MPTVKPVDLARQLDVSPSTLRRWASDFAEHLSEGARASDTRRRYTARDVAVLRRARQLLDAGNTIAAVNDLLRLDDFPTEEAQEAQEAPTGDQGAGQALILLAGNLAGMQQDQAQRVMSLEATVADLRERIARLEAENTAMQRDLDATSRLIETLSARLDAHEGQLGSVGDRAHTHRPGLGRSLSGFES